MKGVLHYQALLSVPKITCFKIISCHCNDLLAGHFEIKKIKELVNKNYFWPTLCHNIEVYVKSYNIHFALKVVCYKPYGNL